MFRSMLAGLVLLVAASAVAQELPPPVMMVRVNDRMEPLKLARVEVDARILGYLAETRMTLTFFNPNQRAMAGDLYFPLPEGATVTGYALDVGGVLVDGVPVEKDEARRVYEKEVRKGIDPGLVEWVKGNNFKTRVFPIPAQGTRTVMVRYASELAGERGEPLFHLPLNFRDPVDDFSLRVEVVKPYSPPVVRKGGPASFTFAQWRDSYVAEAKFQGRALTESLVVALPDVEKRPVVVETAPDGSTYFSITQFPKLVEASADDVPERIVVLWDASGSRGSADHEKELGLLAAYFKQLKADSVDVDLVLFRNVREKVRSFEVENGNAQKLLDALRSVDYDGGTQMASISPLEDDDTPDFFLLFSDGLSNFGKEEPSKMGAPVFAFTAAAEANHAFLKYLALKSGGAYFNLARMTEEEVVARIGKTPFSFISAQIEGGKAETYPSVAQPVRDRFTLVGRLDSDEATIRLEFGLNGKPSESQSFTLRRKEAGEGPLMRMYFAQQLVTDLSILPEKNREKLKSVGRQFGVVTPTTSLLVLESLDQYVEYRIEPPQSLPELRQQYLEALREEKKELKKARKEKIAKVLEMWEKRVKWWETRFKYRKDFKCSEDGQTEGGEGSGMAMGSGGAGAAPAMVAAEARMSVAGSMDRPETSGVEESVGDLGTGAPALGAREGAEREEAKKDKEKGQRDREDQEDGAPEPTVTLAQWNPDTPYLKELKDADKGDRFKVYMRLRKEHSAAPSFFLDCADFFYGQKDGRIALQVLSNVAELQLDDPALLRVLGHRLEQKDELDLARLAFEKVLELRPEEPQSYRDLGLVLDRLGQLPRAAELLYEVVTREWDRFEEIEVVVLMELNRVLARAREKGITGMPEVDQRLVKLLTLDVRIVLTWDTDMSDMDIWVTEPSGEKAFYSHPTTITGGLVSKDFTEGYGPEEYVVRRAMRGTYRIEANFYGINAPTVTGAVTVQAEVFTNFGKKDEKRQTLTLRLEKKADTYLVGEIQF